MAKKNQPISGRLSLTAKGFGFVEMEGRPDIFIDLDHLNTGMDGDVVEVELFRSSRSNRPAGRIRRVVERSGRQIVGAFRKTKDGGKIYPEDARVPTSLLVPAQQLKNDRMLSKLRTGNIVTAVLKQWDDPKSKPIARITEIVGDQNDPGIDLKIIALSKGLTLKFPDAVEKEARSSRMPDLRTEARNRIDLRGVECVTIDPESARDFDDSLSIQQLPDGKFEIGVHIADVSYFVPEGSELDTEAFRRGTSVYFVQSALPMLPEKLSSDLCSLKPGVDRLTFSVLIRVDSLGNTHGYRIGPSIIKSTHRFTYKEANEVLGGKDHKYAGMLHLLELVSQVLRMRRQEKGSIDFDVPEKSIVLDRDGLPVSVRPVEQLESQRLVAEFMLLANRVVATHVVELGRKRKSELPFVYRVHEKPKPEDTTQLVDNLHELGLPYKVGKTLASDDYRNILNMIQNFEFRDFLERVAFYSMTKAVYQTRNVGHFGLAFEAYTHFTSPIRRYADLVVHRLLRQYLVTDSDAPPRGRRTRRGSRTARETSADNRTPSGDRASQAGQLLSLNGRQRDQLSASLVAYLDRVSDQCSKTEKVATAAERDYAKLKSLEFLARKVGRTYEGIISGVTSFGLFVELSRYLIEGLVRVAEMTDDHYRHDEQSFRFVGEKTGKVYRLGDRVQVKIKRVSVADRRADFEFV